MLYIIYCKPDKNQGKKEFINILEEHFGVIPIQKFTSKPKPKNANKLDKNLIYICENSKIKTDEDFLKAVNKYVEESRDNQYSSEEGCRLYRYERQKDTEKYFYGIPQDIIFEALRSEKNYALVCTNIDVIIEIKRDAHLAHLLYNKSGSPNMYVYCLVRQKNIAGTDDKTENHLTIKDLKELYAGNIDKDIPDWLIELPDDTPAVLSYGEARELDFFRYISEFSNLLIVKDYGDSFYQKHAVYVKEVCDIIKKYIGLKQINKTKKIFIIHPMSMLKFDIKSSNIKIDPILQDNQEHIDEQFKKMMYLCLGRGENYEIMFASDIQQKHTDLQECSVQLTDKIIEEIDDSDIVIGDLRNFNQNCLYEIGYAKGNNSKVILILPEQQKSLITELFFDISTYGCAFYDLNSIVVPDLQENALNSFIAKLGIKVANIDANDDTISGLLHNLCKPNISFEEYKSKVDKANEKTISN